MRIDIWIGGIKWDLYSETDIRNTFQVNDIAEVRDRQASYTNSFTCPKTPNNIQIAQGLGISSDTSRFPYEKPSCFVKIDGFDLITKGWVNITETDDEYKIYIYSGIIQFFKAIENKTLGNDLDLSEINHIKNLPTVLASFSNPNYKYLITDYNGLTHYGTDGEIINIDYLIPSAKVKYLWDKVHEKTGFTYSGSTFETIEFLNLFITYPKSVAVDDLEEIVEGSGSRYIELFSSGGDENKYYRRMFLTNFDNSLTWTIPESATYRITLNANNTFQNELVATLRYFISINQENLNFVDRSNSVLIAEYPAKTESNTAVLNVYLNAGDVVSFFDYLQMNGFLRWNSEFSVTIEKYDVADVSFTEELKEFYIPDFMKEVMNQFGLTPFTDEFSNEIRYLTLAERVNGATVKDWSDKFIKRNSENYIYDTYAQQNLFTYQYNDKESSYHNGSISVNNLNIAEKKTVWSSRTYSPEKELTNFYLGTAGNKYMRVFKLYEKEIKEVDGVNEIKYKGLDKRFHFIREQNLITTAVIGSKTFDISETVGALPLGTFSKLDWTSLIRKNYNEFGRVLNDSRLHSIDLALNDVDILTLDLSNLFFFKQEQQYYILNKLNFDEKNAKGEFIRVKRFYEEAIIIDPDDPNEFNLTIVWSDLTNTPKTGTATTQGMQIATLSYPADDELNVFEWEQFNGTTWTGLGSGVSPYNATLISGVQKFRMKAISESLTEVYSNELQYDKLLIDCRSYKVSDYVNQGDDITAWYTDCNGIEREMMDYSTAPNQLLELYFCANKDSVTVNRGTITNLGPC